MLVVKKSASINKTIRMPKDLVAQLEKVATEKGVSFGQLVIQSCRYALEHVVDEQELEQKSDP